MKKILLVLVVLMGISGVSYSQTSYWWRSEAANGNWNETNNWWNGSDKQVPQGGENIIFNNNFHVSMTNNLSATNRYRILFEGTASTSRTIGGSTENTFYNYGANKPKMKIMLL